MPAPYKQANNDNIILIHFFIVSSKFFQTVSHFQLQFYPLTSFHGIMPFSLNWETNNDAIYQLMPLLSSFVKMKYANIY